MRVIVSSAVLAAIIASSLANPCGDPEWKYFPSTNACYKLLSDNMPWTVAEFKCLFQGGHHISIDSAEENRFVNEVAKHAEIWTGAAYFGKDAVYVYSDQKPYGRYVNWRAGKVPKMNRARRCIKMDRNGEWFQSCCKKKTFAICKKPAAYYEASWVNTPSADVAPTTTTTTTTTQAPYTTTTAATTTQVPWWATSTTTRAPYWATSTTTKAPWWATSTTQAPWWATSTTTARPYWADWTTTSSSTTTSTTTTVPPVTIGQWRSPFLRGFHYRRPSQPQPVWRAPKKTQPFRWVPGFRRRRVH